jgi:hypothetical protein
MFSAVEAKAERERLAVLPEIEMPGTGFYQLP